MTILYSCQSLSKSFGTKILFEDLSLHIHEKDRIGLIGPNGSGKSTLLNILAGKENADEGILAPRRGLKIGYLPQSCLFPDISPLQVLIQACPEGASYEKELLAETWLSKLGFSGKEPSAATLSGGWKKRLGLAQELLLEPDLLLLDEPTNHLDLEGILWLEKFLLKEAVSYVLVSHDRYFLQHTTNRILEINRTYPKGMFAIEGAYEKFLEKKTEFLSGQIQQERSLATKMRRETEWLRQGVKARTTKSESRINEAHHIIQEHSDIQSRNVSKRSEIRFVASERETKKLLSAKNLSKTVGDRLLFSHLDLLLSPGSRIGLLGPNGSGKTTLLRLLAGELTPDQGTIKRADNLKIVYFDQERTKLPPGITLRDALSPKGDYVSFHGRQIHVNGWCKRFLFSPDLLDLSIDKLSGGERARISIAHLMLQPADILLLDEPTNDLDIPTLEALEESLLEFPGAMVLITHDRCMIDRICDSLFGFGESSNMTLFADLAQWEASRSQTALKKEILPSETPAPRKKGTQKETLGLTYAEKKEFDQIEEKILAQEDELRKLNAKLEDPSMATNPSRLQELCTAIAVAEAHVERLYLRFEALDHKQRQ
ncbi:MAG: ABC-F family ATP-binding cassette domain-containing protein [Chlamydiales bacterium]|nr:ABC-F family ATP-binding cassette domain-containing protein [Chlamydiales bacterium]